jgi:signal transduction histidine kinase
LTLSIRWRIGLSVFLLVSLLEIGLSGWIFEEVQRSAREGIDQDLIEDLAQLANLLDGPDLALFARAETLRHHKYDEKFFEVYDAAGKLVARSDNVPPEGLGPPIDPTPIFPDNAPSEVVEPELHGAKLTVWERPHPRTRKGHVSIRALELRRDDGHRLVVAESLKAFQKAHWDLRRKLLLRLVAVSLIGACGAWWVARRSLKPIQSIAERARELGAAPVGWLPRTGNRDELDQLADVLNGMVARIRAEVERVRRLSADAAHALRTPLAVLRGMIEVHVRSEPAERAGTLGGALEMADEIAGRINELLLLESLESGRGDQRRWTPIELDRLAAEVVEELQVLAEERGIELGCKVEPAAVRGDDSQLRNAIANLVDNALRHTPGGARVEVTLTAHHHEALLTVIDGGPGLDPEQLERLFERFYTGRDGTAGGLGLPIARAIAEAHGGSLVASSPGGARFDLRIPLASPSAH